MPPTGVTRIFTVPGAIVPPGGGTAVNVSDAPDGATTVGRPFGKLNVAAGKPKRQTKSPRLMSLPMNVPLGNHGHTFHSPLNCGRSSPGQVSKNAVSGGLVALAFRSKTRMPLR